MNRFLFLILMVGFRAYGQPPWYSTEWARIRARMGPIDFDGRLLMSFPIHRIDAAGAAWNVTLDHTVDVDAYDTPSSRWIARGLTCYLVPEARNSLRALLPNGLLLHFSKSGKESRPIRDKGDNWSLWAEHGESVIESPLGNRYIFVHGQLTEIVTYRGVAWRVTAEAGHIRSIAGAGDPSRTLVSCDYDSIWEPVAVRFGDGDVHRFAWEGGLLLGWDAGNRGLTRFEYRDRMVVRVAKPSERPVSIEWKSVPDWNKASDVWWSPIRVSRCDDLSIGYDLGHDGDRFTTTDATTGVKTVTRFNWFSQVVTQQVGDGEPEIVRYNTALKRPGYFVSIGYSNGKLLEAYDYGTNKRLAKITKISADGTESQIAGLEKIAEGWDGEAQPGMPIYEN